ncbi:ABC transporter related protein [Candidatus Ruthia magnifica str. Cm (Calyptogena magnifica)]|uniref:ABC transporter related protein n=1 Tax=Ruthia magnifica subsp. Calyptogena magnifica TaxID=413404 RepID=A1AVC0_RUTMC|nr:ATP-binding cassette domain-containing protein [Candidatus Ruthturnera calyptogenae]ABL01877.1 ABC transporter related protein [Candidatus Ruthia magnifica str. Cm (Calyptogena magnifica)]
MSEVLISANHVSFSHHGKKVLDDVSFELRTGEFITLIGPNGAGKSSLIKILLELIAPDDGKIKKSKYIRLGYTPQKFIPNEFIPISVIDFLKLNQKINTQSLINTTTLTGIETLLHLSLKNLSGGEIQRVLLTRAFLAKPNVLILDEPVQNLDVNGQMHLYKLIQDIHNQQNCAVLMVSHDLHRVMKESTQVLCLYHHICCMGQPETILKNAQFNHLFADQMDELMATYKHKH